MQASIEKMFDKMYPMTDGLKKKAYEKWMTEFRERHGETFKQMTECVESAQNQQAEAGAVAVLFADAVEILFSKRG